MPQGARHFVVAPRREEVRDNLGRLVDLALDVEGGQQVADVSLPAGRPRDRLLRYIQEPLQIDRHRPVEDAPREQVQWCTCLLCPAQSLVDRAGIREGVVDGIPVTELVRDVEMYRPAGGGVGDGCREFGE